MADIATLAIKVDATQAKNASVELDKLSASGKQTEKSIGGMTAKFALAVAPIAATALAIKNSVEIANEYNKSLLGLASVARYSGENIQETLGRASAITSDGLMSVTESATALKNLLSRGFSTEQAVEMINRFKDSAAFGRQSSLEFGQAVVSATEGIKNENSVLVDNAGVTKNVSKMWDDYAASIGKTSNNLTMAEKRTAEYNGVLKETEAQLGNAALAAGGLDGSVARMNKEFNDAAVTIGRSFTPATIEVINLLGAGFKGAIDIGVKPALFLMENLGITAGEVAMKAGLAFDLITSPSKWGNPAARAELEKLFNDYGDIAEEARIKLAGRLSGAMVEAPKIGKDSGARRLDTPTGLDNADAKKQARELVLIQEEKDAAIRQSYLESVQIMADHDPTLKAALAWDELSAKVQAGFLDAETAGKEYAKQMDFVLEEERAAQKDFDKFLADLEKHAADRRIDREDATAKEIADKQEKELQRQQRAWESFTSNVASNMGDVLFKGATDGFNNMGDAFKNLTLRMAADAAAANLTQYLFGSEKGGGALGAFGASVMSFFPSFAGGGSTGIGSRSGGVDGMGGFPAILHPNETVVDHSAGQSTSQPSVTVVQNINIDSRSDQATIMAAMQRSAQMAETSIMNSLQRGGAFARAVGRA